MEQKYINQRIAIAMLKQCALLWEMCISKPQQKGEFTLYEVYNGLSGCDDKVGALRLLDYDEIKYPNVFFEKMRAINGVVGFDEETVRITIPTSDTNPNVGFGCSYKLKGLFYLTKSYCRSTGCLSLLKKTVFGYDSNGKYSFVPELKAPRAVKPAKPKAKAQVLIDPTVAAQIRTALAAVEVA